MPEVPPRPALTRSQTMRSPVTRELEIGRRPSVLGRVGTSAEIEQVEQMVEAAALGPVPERRAVTKAELASARGILDEARTAHASGNEYDATRMQLERELAAAKSLTAGVEEELQRTKDDNKRLKVEFDELQKKFASADLACTKSLSQYAKLKREVEDIKAERDSLYKEIDYLLDEVDVLKENLTIQETNVDTLKKLSERLQEDIAKYKKRQEETADKHRLAILRMETELAKDVDELNKEYEAKEAQLRAMIKESETTRKQEVQDWINRQSRLERAAKEEVKAKNDELQKLRTKIDQLLREQIHTMRDRVKENMAPLEKQSAMPTRSGSADGARPPLDLKAYTSKVMTEISEGKKILSLDLLAKGDDFHSPVYWKGNGPVHAGDISSLDLGVKLSVDNSALLPIPKASRPSTFTSMKHNQEHLWVFGTTHGAEVAVTLRIIPPRQ
eukprot:TRINITY_DN20970_c0_g1_i2.p1 TRINITY_DN20970_c0_g1~~TRINITY_DN20970_c0_g1_i2.p1  ORF type:complete len:458 (+),score=184.57 TRINITY_DN20970_c0_g1_i2:40-1374(+)